MIVEHFTVKGMHCENCAKTIQKILKVIPQIDDVTVSFLSHEAVISFDQKISLQTLNMALSKTDYSLEASQKEIEYSRYRISIYSENPDELQKFYKDVLGFTFDRIVNMPNDYGYVFKLMDNFEVFIARHSEVSGKAKEPVRHIFDLKVYDVTKRFNEIKALYPELNVIAAPFQAPCSIVATFTDPEGNCWQFSENSKPSDHCEV